MAIPPDLVANVVWDDLNLILSIILFCTNIFCEITIKKRDMVNDINPKDKSICKFNLITHNITINIKNIEKSCKVI